MNRATSPDHAAQPGGAPAPAPTRRSRRPRPGLILATLAATLGVGLLSGALLLKRQQDRQRDEAAVDQGRLLLERGSPALALRAVDRVPGRSPVRAEALTVRGLALVALGRVEEARLALERALEAGPVQPMAAKVLAAIYFSRSEADRGLDLLRVAARADPADFRPWYAMGDAYRRLGKPDEAAGAFARALERRAGDRGSRVGLVAALLDLGRAEEATAHLGALLRETPDDPEILEYAARHALDLGDLHAALRLADRCLEIDPDLVDARLARSRIHRASGRPGPALADAEEAARRAPNHPGALNLLAAAEAAAGLADRAAATSARHRDLVDRLGRLHDLTAEIQDRPGDPEPRWRLGQEALALGERTLAEQSFRAALAIDPACRPALDGLGRLGLDAAGHANFPPPAP